MPAKKTKISLPRSRLSLSMSRSSWSMSVMTGDSKSLSENSSLGITIWITNRTDTTQLTFWKAKLKMLLAQDSLNKMQVPVLTMNLEVLSHRMLILILRLRSTQLSEIVLMVTDKTHLVIQILSRPFIKRQERLLLLHQKWTLSRICTRINCFKSTHKKIMILRSSKVLYKITWPQELKIARLSLTLLKAWTLSTLTFTWRP